MELELEFESLPNRKATRLAEYLPGADVAKEVDGDVYLGWLLYRQTAFAPRSPRLEAFRPSQTLPEG